MNCPTCGAPIHLLDGSQSATCEYCHAVYVPEKNDDGVRVFAQASELSCPVCSLPLFQAILARHRILYCTHCRGTLVPMPVFVDLVDALRALRGHATEIAPAPDPRQLDRRTACPQCRRTMDTHYYAGGGNVVIDTCSPCELNWLDAGELISIGRAPDESPWDEGRTD